MPEIEAEILAESKELYTAVAKGTAKQYRNTAKMFAKWYKEDEETDG